jgi:hypothetical protein
MLARDRTLRPPPVAVYLLVHQELSGPAIDRLLEG